MWIFVRETRSDHTMSRPLVRVRADTELAFAGLLGLAPGHGAGGAGAHHTRAGVVLGLVLGLAVGLALISLSAVL
jgi:hypothetical protein